MLKSILHVMSLSITLIFSFLHATKASEEYIEFSSHEVSIPQRLGDLKLYKDYNGFHVLKNNEIYDIQNCFCDPMLKKMTNKHLKSFLGRKKLNVIEITQECLDQINEESIFEITGDEKDMILAQLSNSFGYIMVNQMSDGQYRLEAKMRLLGGGLWGAFRVFGYVALGVACVGIIGAASGATVAYIAGAASLKLATAVGAAVGMAGGAGIGAYIGLCEEGYIGGAKQAPQQEPARRQAPEVVRQQVQEPAPRRALQQAPEAVPQQEPAPRQAPQQVPEAEFRFVPSFNNPFMNADNNL